MFKKIISNLLIVTLTMVSFSNVVQATTINKVVQAVGYSKLSNNTEKIISSPKDKVMSNFEKNKDKKNYKENEIVIRFKDTQSIATADNTVKKYEANIKKTVKNNIKIAGFDSGKFTMEDMLKKLNSDSTIEYAEPNYSAKLQAVNISDPLYSNQWGLKNTITPGIDINVETAWTTAKGTSNVVIGVIDSGIDYNHSDLKDNVWVNKGEIPNNGVDDDGDGYVDDYNGWDFANSDKDPYDDNNHGTHVSGIIAAENNGIGVVGTAPNAQIMPLKAASSDGSLYDSDIVDAINYGVSKGVKIFNCSWGGADFSQLEYDAMKNSNALFVCAAGNNGTNNDIYSVYPANFDLPNIISVAAIDKYGALTSFSNYGAQNVDIAAPGADIYSTLPGGYGVMSGTSMATPYVTGIAALLQREDTNLTTAQVKGYILSNKHSLSTLLNKVNTGGIADAGAAITNLIQNIEKPTVDIIGDTSTAITGTGKPATTIIAKVNGVELGRTIVDDKGNYSIAIEKQKVGTLISVVSLNSDGIYSSETLITVLDKTPPMKPTVNNIYSNDLYVVGTSEPGSTVIVKTRVSDSWYMDVGTVKADNNGNFKVAIGNQNFAGAEFDITASDDAGNLSDTVIVVSIDSLVRIKDFVTRFYQQCLNRQPDETGLSYWADRLKSGTSTGADVANNFISSQEFVDSNVSDDLFVDIMYRAFFDRASDSTGKTYWLNNLSSGISRQFVLASFVNSQEFASLSSSYGIKNGSIVLTKLVDLHPDVAAFTYRFYDKCLSRKPDDSGLNYWVSALVSGQSTAADLSVGFVFSPEFTSKNLSDSDFVAVMYRVFFDREPDTAGQSYWVKVLNSGKSRRFVLANFVGSQEFKNICNTYGIKPGSIS